MESNLKETILKDYKEYCKLEDNPNEISLYHKKIYLLPAYISAVNAANDLYGAEVFKINIYSNSSFCVVRNKDLLNSIIYKFENIAEDLEGFLFKVYDVDIVNSFKNFSIEEIYELISKQNILIEKITNESIFKKNPIIKELLDKTLSSISYGERILLDIERLINANRKEN